MFVDPPTIQTNIEIRGSGIASHIVCEDLEDGVNVIHRVCEGAILNPLDIVVIHERHHPALVGCGRVSRCRNRVYGHGLMDKMVRGIS
jgi:hypothetical protein